MPFSFKFVFFLFARGRVKEFDSNPAKDNLNVKNKTNTFLSLMLTVA